MLCIQLARTTETHCLKLSGFIPVQIWNSEAQDLLIKRKHHVSFEESKDQIQASCNFW